MIKVSIALVWLWKSGVSCYNTGVDLICYKGVFLNLLQKKTKVPTFDFSSKKQFVADEVDPGLKPNLCKLIIALHDIFCFK